MRTEHLTPEQLARSESQLAATLLSMIARSCVDRLDSLVAYYALDRVAHPSLSSDSEHGRLLDAQSHHSARRDALERSYAQLVGWGDEPVRRLRSDAAGCLERGDPTAYLIDLADELDAAEEAHRVPAPADTIPTPPPVWAPDGYTTSDELAARGGAL